jgi:predicted permease
MRELTRRLACRPLVGLLAIATVALGTGGTFAIAALLEALVLRPLPVPEPERLVAISATDERDQPAALPLGLLPQLIDATPTLAKVSGYTGTGLMTVEIGQTLHTASVDAVSGDYYDVLQIQPLMGRLVQPPDVSPAPALVTVVGHRFWKERLNADPNAIGRLVRVEGVPLTIIGVTPETFDGLRPGTATDLTVPLPLLFQLARITLPIDQSPVGYVVGRLREGSTRAALTTHLHQRWPDVVESTAAQLKRSRPRVVTAASGFSFIGDRYARSLTLLLVLAGVLLVAACGNLAGVLIVESARRAHEDGIRLALGATRGHLVRDALAESLALACAGTLGGVAVAFWCGSWLTGRLARTLATAFTIEPSAWIVSLGAVAGTSVTIAVLAGAGPAWIASRRTSHDALLGTRTTVPGTQWLSRVVIAAEVALTLVLVTAAGLLAITASNLRRVDLGFDPDRVMLAGLLPQPGTRTGFPAPTYYPDVVARLEALPGVETVSLANLPFGIGRLGLLTTPVWADRAGDKASSASATLIRVTPGFARALGLTLLGGREVDWTDRANAPPVAVITSTLATQLFGNRPAVGQSVAIDADGPVLRVVGVVRDARLLDIRQASTCLVFVPLLQSPVRTERASAAFIRMRDDSTLPIDVIRQTIAAAGQDYVRQTARLGHVLREASQREDLSAAVGVFAGVFAAVLSGLGLYGLLAFQIARRRREIAVRVAVGATPASIWSMVIAQSMRLVAAGLLVGIPLSLIAARYLSAYVYGVSPFDARVQLGAVAMLLAIALTAAFAPARTAGRVDPIAALRAD